jgi:hypothetical protein
MFLRSKFLLFVLLPCVLFSPYTQGSSRGDGGAFSFQVAASDKPASPAPKPELLKNPQNPGENNRHTEDSYLEIRDIKIESKKGVRDTVHIFSNRPFTPSVLALEGDSPRFVIDILHTTHVRIRTNPIPVHGDFIQQVRTRHDRSTGTFRLVLDLHPLKNYKVNQMFFEAENIYAIEVEEEREMHPP